MNTEEQARFEQKDRSNPVPDGSAESAERVRINQKKLRSELKSQYDFIVCGSGSSGSVVAGRLAENYDVSVLLIEAGGDDDVPTVNDADGQARVILMRLPSGTRLDRSFCSNGACPSEFMLPCFLPGAFPAPIN